MSFRDFSPQKTPPGRYNNNNKNNKQNNNNSPLRRTSSANKVPPTPNSLRSDQDSLAYSRSQSDSTYQTSTYFSPNYMDNLGMNVNNDNDPNQNSPGTQTLIQQREDEYALQVMQQREGEIKDINDKMNVVNEIYKDLGEVVEGQQEHVDRLENQFGNAAQHTQRGLEQIEKANIKANKKQRGGESNNEGEEGDTSKRKQFALFRYMQKSVDSLTNLVSICGGSGASKYVNETSTDYNYCGSSPNNTTQNVTTTKSTQNETFEWR